MTTRRQFLAGLLASAAAPALPKISIDIEAVPLRGPPVLFSVLDEWDYSIYKQVGTEIARELDLMASREGFMRKIMARSPTLVDPDNVPRFQSSGPKNVRAVTFFDDVEIGDKFIVSKTKFVETEMTVADVRRRELSYSNLFHKDPEFDQAMDDYIGALNGNSGDEAQGHVEGREAVCDPVGQDERRKTV